MVGSAPPDKIVDYLLHTYRKSRTAVHCDYFSRAVFRPLQNGEGFTGGYRDAGIQ